MNNINTNPDFLFEISWEVCNKIGGIYTVLSTKSNLLYNTFNDHHIYIGPDVSMETTGTPDFEEDKSLYKRWTDKASKDGLKFRIGRWKIPGNPVVILVELNQFFSEKDKIFAHFWERFKLDSISGEWDYIEPAIFGYAAGKIIEHFYEFNVSAEQKIVAQFHEWMSGTGILYLKDRTPQISTIFTTHATVPGRSIANNGRQLYKELKNITNPDETASYLGINAKYSLEKLSSELCDVFTTVSKLTAKEAEIFYKRKANPLLLNGFNRQISPDFEFCKEKKTIARKIILDVVNSKLNTQMSDDTTIIMTSGRYEYRNKGLDLFLDSLAQINKSNNDKEILAVMAVPADSGPPSEEEHNNILTHSIHHPDTDAIMQTCRYLGLDNKESDKVKIIFIPVYLDGNDGVFNLSYYNFLAGVDITVFASYYEPWGYTPLESIALGVPTITSTLAGFGLHIQQHCNDISKGVAVLERNDDNYNEAKDMLSDIIKSFINLNKDDKLSASIKAFDLSNKYLWDEMITNYFEAYKEANARSAERADLYSNKMPDISINQDITLIPEDINPKWRKLYIKQEIPKEFIALSELNKNLWWSWNDRAINLFKYINPKKWEELGHNPITLIESLSSKDFNRLSKDEKFKQELKEVHAEFKNYMNEPKASDDTIAYFSMEYGIENNLKIFSGGLGILAGDYLKEMSDRNENLIGLGLLYRYGYFKQELSPNGEQINLKIPQIFTQLPLIPVRDDEGNWMYIKIALPARVMYAKIWRVDVGRIPLYLLDTDVEMNRDEDKQVTHQLYGGNNENRLKQELLLGVGGIRLLRQIGLYPTIFHLNEGHAAFAGIERLREYVQDDKLTFHQAMEVVKGSSLFTTHTPVPAGHDFFPEDLLRTYISHYPKRIGCTWEKLISLGKINPTDIHEKFSMSVLAINTSQEVNGVSKIHGQVTRDMFLPMFKGYYSDELYIDHVTNGVHYPTWAAEEWKKLHVETFGNEFLSDQSNPNYWHKIYDIHDNIIWETKETLRKRLIDFLKVRLRQEMKSRSDSPQNIINVTETISDKKITIGFARRFATYKRAHLLFQNLERLSKLVNNPEYPVQFIFAGKAHPADKAGQDLIKRIIEISRMPQFLGKIIFVENYDMELSKKLLQGCDIWLNTPTRPLEASGTSGEKAVMNGVLNLSVLDGWWAEGYKKDAGWALSEEKTYDRQGHQDILDSETIYFLLENEIIPTFYDRDKNNIPHKWVKFIKNNFAEIAPHFTMKRMTDEYFSKFYNKLIDRAKLFYKDNYSKAIAYSAWKQKMRYSWYNIELLNIEFPDSTNKNYKIGDKFDIKLTIKANGFTPDDLVVDVIFGRREIDEYGKYYKCITMPKGVQKERTIEYHYTKEIQTPGIVDVAIRIRPSNELMPNNQALALVKYL